jgi:TAP-like protein
VVAATGSLIATGAGAQAAPPPGTAALAAAAARRAGESGRTEGSSPNQTRAYPLLIFCQDWSLPVHTYREYAAHLDRVGKLAPDLREPRALLAISLCLGTPGPVPNPQHRLRVHHSPKLLLTNAVHDPASGYNRAFAVARQLGRRAVLLSYEGAGHGTYNSSDCARTAIDRYLISLVPPAPVTRCPAIERP